MKHHVISSQMNPIAYTVKQLNVKVQNKVKVTESALSYMQYTLHSLTESHKAMYQTKAQIHLFVCLFSARFGLKPLWSSRFQLGLQQRAKKSALTLQDVHKLNIFLTITHT